MVHPPRENLAGHLIEKTQDICRSGATSFTWSLDKIRVAAFALLGAATPAAAALAVSNPFVKWACIVWLTVVALLMHGLSRRASNGATVLSVDRRGIFDRRLMSTHIAWQEIKAIWPVNTDRNHTVDIHLRWPATTLRETRWSVRIGAYCQMGYGVPAVTINMLLLDGDVSQMLEAIARYRPDLLHHTNRGMPRTAYP